MVQIAFDYPAPWPKSGRLEVAGQPYEIPISPQQARRRANGYLAGYVTMSVTAGDPMLVLGDRPVWRIPARLQLSGIGVVSTLGILTIDATTGEVIPFSAETLTEMQDLAHAIAEHYAPTAAPAD